MIPVVPKTRRTMLIINFVSRSINILASRTALSVVHTAMARLSRTDPRTTSRTLDTEDTGRSSEKRCELERRKDNDTAAHTAPKLNATPAHLRSQLAC